MYEAIIKVATDAPPDRRSRQIAEGISYACALLMDEYSWSAAAVIDMLERVQDEVQDHAEDL